VVDVAVTRKDGHGGGYAVTVEVPAGAREGWLVLRGVESAGETVPLAPAELSFPADAALAPFHISFLLADAATGSEVRTHRGTSFCLPVGVGRGRPAPLGLSLPEDGAANFAVFSRSAKAVVLCLYGCGDELALEIELNPYINRTGDVWHVELESVEGRVSYGFRCGLFGTDRPMLDPYAKVIGDFVPGTSVYDERITVPSMRCLASLANAPSYNWGRDKHPRLPLEKLVVYRANVALFTKDKSSDLPDNAAGTFSGLAGKVGHFKRLGVNAVLLEPVFPFRQEKGAYFPYHFFSPMIMYSSECCSISAIKSMKDMVKAMHRNGIEVLLEVVFTHTAEGGAECQMLLLDARQVY
jgi:isoamylase